MAVKLNSIKKEHELLVKDLQSTKQKIKNLTGIKIKVITLLKEKLGKNIKIDPKSGNLRLSSNVLFDEGKSELKPNAKAFLKNAVYDYFQTITENKEINKYIDTIVIEGHTNSKGTFLYNLDLSQKRAYSVMDFLLSLDFKNKDELRNLVVASGRSYLDPIFDKNGKEDSEASRRIEIKLNIKNEEAMKEIESILK
jgi:chemotaxis protein MotB